MFGGHNERVMQGKRGQVVMEVMVKGDRRGGDGGGGDRR